jgi:NhaA family Na+:H+ antiporter
VHFWHAQLYGNSLEHWINDGLMAIFFLLIGLELEREVYIGELSNLKKAMFPISGAIGGMIVPAAIFISLNYGLNTQAGAGIPMATDIAFALGILSLLGNKVPLSLKIFLTALAVMDDLGAIIVIALFYSKTIVLMNLLIALLIFGALLLLNRLKIHLLLPYLIGGVAMWYFMLHSGVHATIAGVLLAFAIPFGKGDDKSISYKLQHWLHKPVAFIILPIFALANTAIVIHSGWYMQIVQPIGLGILLGLVIGKPLGIYLCCKLTTKIGISNIPEQLNWKQIAGVGMLGGIGFTMSIFISLLAFEDISIVNTAKMMILTASLIASVKGYVALKFNKQ